MKQVQRFFVLFSWKADPGVTLLILLQWFLTRKQTRFLPLAFSPFGVWPCFLQLVPCTTQTDLTSGPLPVPPPGVLFSSLPFII